MAVDLNEEDICCVSLCNVLRAVQCFEFNALLTPIKERLVIRPATGDLFIMNLSVACIDGSDHEDKLSLPPAGTSPREDSTPELNARSCAEFTAKAVNNEAVYLAVAVSKEKELTAELAWETTKLLRGEEFAPRGFCLDTFRPPPLFSVTADAIGFRYGRLTLKAKTKFHVDQMKVEVARLRILVQQGCRRIKAIKSEMSYMESLEAERKDQVQILCEIHQQQKEL